MMRWQRPAAAVAFLMTLLTSACSSRNLGNATEGELIRTLRKQGTPRSRWSSEQETLIRNGREKPHPSTPPRRCPYGNMYWISQACEKPAARCCSMCAFCEDASNQVIMTPCRAFQNTECGCKSGYFDESEYPGHLNCQKCTDCLSMNRQTQQNCSRKVNTECGGCLPGFCPSGESCQPCPTARLQSNSDASRPPVPTTPSSKSPRTEICSKDCKFAIGVCGCLLLLAAALIVYYIRRFAPRAEKSYSTSPCVQTGQSTKVLCNGTAQMPPLFLHSEPPAASLAEKERLVSGAPPICGLLQGRNMYAVIDAVPVRRWKEFVRGLGLRDREIELVELEHSQFREQQYEMLKRWCQQQGPSAGAIFAVLESMQLGGCAQELREQLHANS